MLKGQHMENTTVDALNGMVDNFFQDNQKEITNYLFERLNDSMTTEQILPIMVANCLSLSMKLTSRFLLDLLQSGGVLQIDEREIAKQFLKCLSSDLEK